MSIIPKYSLALSQSLTVSLLSLSGLQRSSRWEILHFWNASEVTLIWLERITWLSRRWKYNKLNYVEYFNSNDFICWEKYCPGHFQILMICYKWILQKFAFFLPYLKLFFISDWSNGLIRLDVSPLTLIKVHFKFYFFIKMTNW